MRMVVDAYPPYVMLRGSDGVRFGARCKSTYAWLHALGIDPPAERFKNDTREPRRKEEVSMDFHILFLPNFGCPKKRKGSTHSAPSG